VAEAVDGRDPGAAEAGDEAGGAFGALLGAPRTSARMRPRSSAAALSVKVKASTESGETPSSQTSLQ
jgi:hypothetical protein